MQVDAGGRVCVILSFFFFSFLPLVFLLSFDSTF